MIEQITIRSLQHYLYCKHRWGLIEIDKAWQENYFVVKANLLHSRVHNPGQYTVKGAEVFTEVDVWNDEWNLYGKLDCLEKKKSVYTIVEYKPTKPKNDLFNHDDLMQLFAQKLCVDSIFKCNCHTVIYYADVRKRYEYCFDETESSFQEELRLILEEMHSYLASGKIPPKSVKQKCNGCSLKDLCIPKALDRHKRTNKDNIMELLEEY